MRMQSRRRRATLAAILTAFAVSFGGSLGVQEEQRTVSALKPSERPSQSHGSDSAQIGAAHILQAEGSKVVSGQRTTASFPRQKHRRRSGMMAGSQTAASWGEMSADQLRNSIGLRSTSEGRDIGLAQPYSLEALSDPRLPQDFDWATYGALYPDLAEAGIDDEKGAQEHYIQQGRQEGRVYRRLRVLLHYTACTGLIRQLYSHTAAFVLAAATGAELVLPPALMRNSFASYYSPLAEENEVSWETKPLSLLLDVDRMIQEWKARGVLVHEVGALPCAILFLMSAVVSPYARMPCRHGPASRTSISDPQQAIYICTYPAKTRLYSGYDVLKALIGNCRHPKWRLFLTFLCQMRLFQPTCNLRSKTSTLCT